MSLTTSITLQPGEWTVIAPLDRIHMLQVKDQKSIRVHFGDIRHPPELDTDDYIVMQGYNPSPLAVERMPSELYAEACLFARPDGNEPAKVTAVTLKRLTPALFPTSARLPDMKVDKFDNRQIRFMGSSDVFDVNMAVTAGALPAGMTLNAFNTDNLIWLVAGTPAVAGDYAFTITANYGANYGTGTIAQAYALKVVA